MEQREAIERLKRWLVPSSLGGWVLAAFLLFLVFCAWAYSARDELYKTYRGMQPGADPGPAFAASEKLELKKNASGARVTLNWVYAEEDYVSMGYEVEDLEGGRQDAGHLAEFQPEGVVLTDQSETRFRMVDSFFEGAPPDEPDNVAKGPLQNGVAFKPEEGLEPSEEHHFRLAFMGVVFPTEPEVVFEFEIPVHAVPVVEVNQKAKAEDVTLTLERVMNSPGRPQAVICYEPPDDEHHWILYGGEGTLEGGQSKSGWTATGSMRGVPPAECQTLMLEGPVEGRTLVEVTMIEGDPGTACRSAKEEAAWQACMEKRYRTIRGPWRFEFKVPNP